MSYDSEVLTDVPLVWLKLLESTGAYVDYAGYFTGSDVRIISNEGSLTRGVSGIVPNKPSQNCTTFIAGYVTAKYNSQWLFGANFSAEVWLKPTGITTAGDTIVCHDDDGNNLRWRLWFDSSKRVGVVFRNAAGSYLSFSGTTVCSPGNVYHVILTYDGTNFRLYVNGALENTYASSIYYTTITPNLPFAIGAIKGGSGINSFYTGKASDASYYDHVLSAGRVLIHYNSGLSTYANNVVSCKDGTTAIQVKLPDGSWHDLYLSIYA